MLLAIENTPRDYAWGRHGAISALLGLGDTQRIEAELWLGAHAGSPARVAGGETTLLDVAPDLPFLLKVMAIDAPLSIQAHPNAAQAREGFERENAAGIPLDAAGRNYRDPFAKPECIVAVTDRFEALCGFRPAALAAEAVTVVAAGDPAIAPLLERLQDDATVGDALTWLLRGGPEVAAALEAVVRGLPAAPAEFDHVRRIARLNPGDPGILGALLLNHAVLRAGEALHLSTGNVHAYLDGIGIELMAPSDNVLRGGLTVKHVDVTELARVIDPAASPVPWLVPTELPGGGRLYEPDDPEAPFSLAFTDSTLKLPLAGPAIALCTAGSFSITGERSSRTLGRGEAVLVTPDELALVAEGAGALYVAR